MIEAQAFQNAACNWRCWYCYVPFELLAAKEEHADWLETQLALIGQVGEANYLAQYLHED